MLGHTGFIGQAILSTPTDIQFNLSKNRINLENNKSSDLILREAIDTNSKEILDLAWQSNNHDQYDKLETHNDWRKSTEHLARAAVKAGLKIYLIGTCEDNNPPTSNQYAIAKSKLKESLRDLIRSGAVVWLRPFYIVSISEMRPRLIRGILESESSNFTIESPLSTNDFILVEDVAIAILRCLENEATGEIDIGSGLLTTNIKIARLVCEMQNMPIPKTSFQQPKIGKIAEIETLESLNWKPELTLAFLNKEHYE